MTAPSYQVKKVVPIKHEGVFAAEVEIGPVAIDSIWISGVPDRPRVTWPRTGKGWPVVFITHVGLRNNIEAELIRRALKEAHS